MPALEFCLPPQDLPRLLKETAIVRRGGRAATTELVWHDTASAALAADHLSLCAGKAGWRLERACPRQGELWPPGTPPPIIAEEADIAAFHSLPGPLMPIAGFRGDMRVMAFLSDGAATLTVLNGALRGVAQEKPVCRVQLQGPAELLTAVSDGWAATLPIEVPRWSLAVEATALARGASPPPRQIGGPAVAEDMSVADAIEYVIGYLTDVIIAGVDDAGAGRSAEPVHAMRVAVRRLRSALSIFRRAADGPAFIAMKAQLVALAQVLGAARDWDVFLAGTGQAVAAAMPGDERITALLALAAKRREGAYAALRREFSSAGFRQLCVGLVQLGALRPWQVTADEDQRVLLASDAAKFAGDSLARQYEHMLDHGADISGLPTDDLHALRKRGKRLRYTAEFFAPQFGQRSTRRFVRRVSQLQEALGQMNDGASVAGLMHALRGGPDRQFAIGAVQGFTAARSMDARRAIATAWHKLRLAKPFWL